MLDWVDHMSTWLDDCLQRGEPSR